jgi:hypothetical protein
VWRSRRQLVRHVCSMAMRVWGLWCGVRDASGVLKKDLRAREHLQAESLEVAHLPRHQGPGVVSAVLMWRICEQWPSEKTVRAVVKAVDAVRRPVRDNGAAIKAVDGVRRGW